MKLAPARRQRGQLVFFFALCAIPIALGLAYLFNTAELLSRKARTQDAADAAALAQATWTARSLNVMSTNNVAFTQVAAIDTAAAAINLTMIDMSQFLTRTAIQKSLQAAAACPVGGFINLACDEALARLAQVYAAARTIEDLLALAFVAHREFIGHAQAYADSNDRLARNFAGFSARMQASLARSNGLATPPRLVAVGWDGRPMTFGPQYDRLGLPVARVDALAGLAPDGYSRAWQAIRGVNRTGHAGTQRYAGLPLARNFRDHGYRDGQGPWPLARDPVRKTLKSAVLQARLIGWTPTAETEPKFDRCWDIGSSTPLVPVSCYKGVPGGPPVPLYAAAASTKQSVASWGVTDVLVLTKATRTTGAIVPKRYRNALPATYGLAKARVYNATRPDLYSSDWRAALVPVTSWDRSSNRFPPNVATALNRLVQADPLLARVLARIGSNDLPYVLAQ